jgi:hypothetical protein
VDSDADSDSEGDSAEEEGGWDPVEALMDK